MKTAYLLFGLATSACVSGPSSETQYPLCGKDGAPACGNIGQVGRNERAPATSATRVAGTLATPHASAAASGTATGFVGTVFDTSRRIVPVLTRVLVGASSEIQRVSPLHRPLVDHREQVACGNVMTKGGSIRRCRHPEGVVTEVALDENGQPETIVTYSDQP